ncbi:hypothetical protein DFH28DRAFT_110656 [Melampsora americana]|nr:hypothetical protein DFH28DRAFT_110656 [Melampsora americana]
MMQYGITYLILSAALGAIASGSPLPTQIGTSNTKGGDLMPRSPTNLQLRPWFAGGLGTSFWDPAASFKAKLLREEDSPRTGRTRTSTTSDPMASNLMASDPMATNSMASNSMASNSMASNSMASDPMATNSMGSNWMASDPMATNSMASNSMASNSMASNSMASDPMATNSMGSNWMATSYAQSSYSVSKSDNPGLLSRIAGLLG